MSAEFDFSKKKSRIVWRAISRACNPKDGTLQSPYPFPSLSFPSFYKGCLDNSRMQLDNNNPPPVNHVVDQEIKLEYQQEQWQSGKTRCRAFHELASINASGSELYIAAIDLFGLSHISALSPNDLQHLIYQLRADVIVQAILKRRMRTFLRWESRALNELAEDWNLEALVRRYMRRMFYARTQTRIPGPKHIWRMYAIILLQRRLEETPGWKEAHPGYKPITSLTWAQYEETALMYATESTTSEDSFEGCQLLYNYLLLRNKDLTSQFFGQVPNPRVAMTPEQLLNFIRRVSTLKDHDALRFTKVFFYHLVLGRVFTTMYTNDTPILHSPDQPLAVNISANAEPILEADICRTLAYS